MPLIGHIRNARATSADAAAPSDAALFRAPEDFAELDAALADMQAAGVDRLVIEGGDGTVREVLSRAPEIWAGRPPEICILPRGNTNLIARKTGGVASAAEATSAEKTTVLPMLKVERAGERPLRGFIMGAGAYETATRIAQEEIAARHGPQVLLAVLRLLTSRALRAGAPIGVGDAPPAPRMLFALTTLPGSLIFGCEPFWGGAGGPIRWLDIDAHPPLLLLSAPFVALGAPQRWMRRAYRSGDAEAIELRLGGDFVLEGERFSPGPDGLLRISAAETATFLAT